MKKNVLFNFKAGLIFYSLVIHMWFQGWVIHMWFRGGYPLLSKEWEGWGSPLNPPPGTPCTISKEHKFWLCPCFSKKSHIFKFLPFVTVRLQHLNNYEVFLFSLVGKWGWKCWKWCCSSESKATTWSPETSSYWFQCGVTAVSGQVKCKISNQDLWGGWLAIQST